MTDEEKARRIEAITEMFIAEGTPLTDDRLKAYGNGTQFIPIGVFKQSCRNAVANNESGFVPNIGKILKEAKILAPAVRTPGQGISLPRWFRRQLARNSREERPRELGSRSGKVERIRRDIE